MDSVSQQAFLYFEEGALARQRLPVDKPSLIIGRGGGRLRCDIVLPERQVSRQHAEVLVEEGRHYLRDMGSKNGTYLNGRAVTGVVELRDGDEIQIALCERIRFVGADATLPLADLSAAQPLRLDAESRRVWLGLVEVTPPLSPAQYRLLECLHENDDKVCSRDEIVSAVWSDAERDGVTEQAIDALVRRLRDRLAEIDPDGQYVITVRGHGFRLDAIGGRKG